MFLYSELCICAALRHGPRTALTSNVGLAYELSHTAFWKKMQEMVAAGLVERRFLGPCKYSYVLTEPLGRAYGEKLFAELNKYIGPLDHLQLPETIRPYVAAHERYCVPSVEELRLLMVFLDIGDGQLDEILQLSGVCRDTVMTYRARQLVKLVYKKGSVGVYALTEKGLTRAWLRLLAARQVREEWLTGSFCPVI